MNARYSKLNIHKTQPMTSNSTFARQAANDELALRFLRHTSNAVRQKGGFVLLLVLMAVVILMALIIGSNMSDYQVRLQAVLTKSETEAMLAAEAGYESAIFWMGQQEDILGSIAAGNQTGSLNFGTATCSYTISFQGWLGQKPIFEIKSTGISGRPSFTRIVDVNVVQETCGWAMGSCMVPNGTSSTTGVYFASGEIINMPIHINKQNDNPDVADIFISGTPTFLQEVEMGEDRYTSGGTDKYSSILSLFQAGIKFDQPTVRITDATAVQDKVTRFKNSTLAAYQFTPAAPASAISGTKCSAVQLEFYVSSGGVGMVRIDPNCTVVLNSPGPSDYSVVSGSNPMSFNTYNIYAYHYKKTSDPCIAIPITSTYVTQTIGGYTSAAGGQIYVNGNVVIGGGEDANFTDQNNMIVKGTMTVVATGNIWIADSIKVYGTHDTTLDPNGIPSATNTNILGLIAQGVIKVVDPGLSPTSPPSYSQYTYRPIGIKKPSGRYLPNPTIVEAAMTVGGGGWGAENVNTPTNGRRTYSSPQDDLVVHGSITEVVRGIIGHVGSDGYIKQYYIDTRLMSGILPGDIWLSGKYIPAPAGWHDHSAD